jgi:hypothetical protein
VALAIASGKPFAVVPCCVFPRESGGRRQAGADAAAADLVVTYPEFVDYLQNLHPKIERECLAFQGRNVVLHVRDWRPAAPGGGAGADE